MAAALGAARGSRAWRDAAERAAGGHSRARRARAGRGRGRLRGRVLHGRALRSTRRTAQSACARTRQRPAPAKQTVRGDEELAGRQEERDGHLRREGVVVVEAVDCQRAGPGLLSIAQQRCERRRQPRERNNDSAKSRRSAVKVRRIRRSADQNLGFCGCVGAHGDFRFRDSCLEAGDIDGIGKRAGYPSELCPLQDMNADPPGSSRCAWFEESPGKSSRNQHCLIMR